MICYVYRSNRKRDTYLYVEKIDDFSAIPEAVMSVFGQPEFSLSFELAHDKKLAQADTREVLKSLATDGFYLQLPKTEYDIASIEQQIVSSLHQE